MKEYGGPKGAHDLRKGELVKPYGPGWKKVARILHGIRMMDLSEEKQQELSDAMHPSICAFNLKKQGDGKSSTSSTKEMVELALIAMKDRDFIQQQFAIYDPDLTICGGTLQIFRYVVRGEGIEENVTEQGKKQYLWYERSLGKYVVGINHPADRGVQSPQDVIEVIKKICLRNGS